MPLCVRCPTGHKMIVPDSRLGRLLRCPRCDETFVARAEEQVRGQGTEDRSRETGVRGQESGVRGQESAVGKVDAGAVDALLAVAAAATEERVAPPQDHVAAVSQSPRPVHDPPERAAATPPVVEPPQQPQPVSAPPVLPQPESEAEEPSLPDKRSDPTPPPLPVLSFDSRIPTRNFRPPTPESRFPTPDPHWVPSAYLLAVCLAAAALFSMAPAAWDVVEYLRIAESPFVARWALVVLLLGVVQIAYAAFLLQLPDWTSVWVVTLDCLAQAALFAMALGLVLVSSEGGVVVRALELSDKLAGGRALLWCLAMVCLWTILALFAGRLSVRWRRAELLLRRAGL